jgi:hypothetical protein
VGETARPQQVGLDHGARPPWDALLHCCNINFDIADTMVKTACPYMDEPIVLIFQIHAVLGGKDTLFAVSGS